MIDPKVDIIGHQTRPILRKTAKLYIFGHPDYPKWQFAIGTKVVDDNPTYWLELISQSYRTVDMFFGKE